MAVATQLEELCINSIRFLIDAVEKAESGHPGLPMGGLDGFVLWDRLRFNPNTG